MYLNCKRVRYVECCKLTGNAFHPCDLFRLASKNQTVDFLNQIPLNLENNVF